MNNLSPTQIAHRILKGQDPFRSSTTRVYAPLKAKLRRIRATAKRRN